MSIAQFRNVGGFIKALAAFKAAASAAATITGPAIDRTGYGSCVLHHQCGDATGGPTTQTVSCKLQDSADGSTGWADVAGAAPAALTANNAAAEVDVDLSGARRYVRVVETVAFTGGTSPAIPVAGTIVLGGASALPAA
jgi:hypothetical protein